MTDWIEHTTDTCPVDPDTVVEVRCGDGKAFKAMQALFWDWATKGMYWSVTHYRIITPAQPPEPEMTNPPNYLDTLSEEQRRRILLSCPTKPEPDFIALRLECLKLALQESSGTDYQRTADIFLHYVLNGSVDKA